MIAIMSHILNLFIQLVHLVQNVFDFAK
jgi:hypothetical protein